MKHKQTYKTEKYLKRKIPIPSERCINSGFLRRIDNDDKDERNEITAKGIYLNVSRRNDDLHQLIEEHSEKFNLSKVDTVA